VGTIGISKKAGSFTESVIRDMTRLAIQHQAINLAQGFPDFACPQELKDAAKAAIDADLNQYAITRRTSAKPSRASSRPRTAWRSIPTRSSASPAARPRR
jgi:hypothetical protein